MANLLNKAMRAIPGWQDNLKASCLQAGFGIKLTRAMCEFLSAVADGVWWDRAKYGAANPYPDNFLATSAALFKRGLIVEKPQAERDANKHREHLWEWTHWNLTPAGEHVVGLLKLVGLFTEADAAIDKKHRNGRRG